MRKRIFLIGFGIIFLFLFGRILLLGIQFIPLLWQLEMNHTINLNSSNNTINILLLGIGGGTHDGPNLSDTVIFVSINQTKNTITLISIPRDLWVIELKGKINTDYAMRQTNQ